LPAQAQKKRPGCPGRSFSNQNDLVPASAITATVTATATAISAAAATAISAAATAAESTTTTATAAAFTRLHRARFVDGQRAAIDFLAMELRDRGLGLIRRAHFDKAETAGTSRNAIVDHLHPRDVARLGKKIGQVVFCHAEGQIAHIEFYAHFLLGWLADVSGIGSTLPLR
jgi:hypothetical protein